MKLIDIIVPCFNESECIDDTIFELTNFIKSENQYKFNIIFINDGSTDNTLKIISNYAKDYPNIKIINFTKNFGHQAAVSAGINHSFGDAAIIIDADLQDPISVASKMIDLWESGFDVVSGKRNKRDGERLFKILSSKYFYRFLNFISETNIPLDTGDFRLISKKVVNEFNKLVEQRKYIRGLISWMGFKSTFVSYDRVKRNKGISKYNFQKSFNLALDGITSFSIRPLRIIGLIGFLISIISIFLILYVFFIKTFQSDLIKGWASVVTIILFFSGFNLIFLGIMGEYIARIFTNQQNRPEYIIDSKINLKE
jgi:dolichol-phosphate mannosyltransferase|tara:strand:+ start:3915 stop:4850 length:936 start_codon:yes stop_codon:yes gene_type:complete